MNISSINFTSRMERPYSGERPVPRKRQDGEKHVVLSENITYPEDYMDGLKSKGVNVHWSDDDNLDKKILAPDDRRIRKAVDKGVNNIAERVKTRSTLTYTPTAELIEDIKKGKEAETENNNLVEEILENAKTIGMGQAAEEELAKREELPPCDCDTDIDTDIDGYDESLAMEDIDDIFGGSDIEQDND